jgi:DNA (cytosine-5)-methyltransferase 1
MNKKYKYIDLFCGAGGFSLGFDEVGFENIFSLDIEPNFCETYRQNFPTHKLLQRDIKKISNEEILRIIDSKIVDVIIGGPPCQGFSIAGNIGRQFIDDPRNHLFKEFARVVDVVKPKYFIMENVAKLFTHNQGNTRKEILNIFTTMGYHVDCKVLNTVNFGVPQVRNRVIFIGNRITDNVIFPEKISGNNKTVKDAIGHLPILKSGEIGNVPNHTAMKHSIQMLHKMSFIKNGGNRNDIPESIRPKSGDVRKYIRYKSDEPAVCVTGDMRKVFHYEQNRALTVRELAALQTFPDSFIFKGTSLSQQQQVGNAVPPLFAKILAESILKMIKNDESIS